MTTAASYTLQAQETGVTAMVVLTFLNAQLSKNTPEPKGSKSHRPTAMSLLEPWSRNHRNQSSVCSSLIPG